MNFCSECGASDILRVFPPGGIGLRYQCTECSCVHYRNPRVVAGCLATWRDQVLLCRRNIEPCRGLWTLPAGYLELGETLEEGAAREAREEAGIEVCDMRVFALYDLPQVGEVYILYLAAITAPNWRPGPESMATRLFNSGDIPWHALAFSMVREALTAWVMMDRTAPSPVFSADFVHVADGALGVRRRREQR